MSPFQEHGHQNKSHRHHKSRSDSTRDFSKDQAIDYYHNSKDASQIHPRHNEGHGERRERREERDTRGHPPRVEDRDRRDDKQHRCRSTDQKSNKLHRSNAVKIPKDKQMHGGSGGKSPRPPPRGPSPGDLLVDVVDGVKGVIKDGVKIAKRADRACDGTLSDIAREVGMLALEHQAQKHRIPIPPRK